MTHRTIRAAMVAIVAALPLTAAAEGIFVPPPPSVVFQGAEPLTGIHASVAWNLHRYGYGGIDVRQLSASQLATIHHFAHSGQSEGDIRSHIRSALRGGLLQRGLDRLSR